MCGDIISHAHICSIGYRGPLKIIAPLAKRGLKHVVAIAFKGAPLSSIVECGPFVC